MRKLLFSLLLSVSLISLTGCGEDNKTETKKVTTPAMKCEAGKCGAAMEKAEVPTQKCTADAKCGDK